jgi:hypothetical protein
MFIPDLDFLPIPDPGSTGQKGTGSRIRNTASRTTHHQYPWIQFGKRFAKSYAVRLTKMPLFTFKRYRFDWKAFLMRAVSILEGEGEDHHFLLVRTYEKRENNV